ncbi:hypothetical protein C8R47DRAFT_1227768 [Mycena vitilis]|nr:hypothetical protein C8R47DRAFT_1227768 [Mycena vitilis]
MNGDFKLTCPGTPLLRQPQASPSPASGVKGVTRKVIRTLEGLDHVMEVDADDEAESLDEEVVAPLKADRRAGKQRALEEDAEALSVRPALCQRPPQI